MNTSPTALEQVRPTPVPVAPKRGLGPVRILLLAIWFGLAAGALEVVIVVLRKSFLDLNRLYWMPRQFPWLTPIADSAIFSVLGVMLALVAAVGGRRGRWLATRLLCGLAVLPVFWAAFPRIYGPAGFVFALGAGVQAAVVVERGGDWFRRMVWWSTPVFLLVPILAAAGTLASERLAAWRESNRPAPDGGRPNVLLVVLDTVAAGHLGLYGYNRPTSPTLSALAERGIRFSRAIAPSSWTLPSHASFFTGCWPHELSAGWLTPLDGSKRTLAEFLGQRGYATAGFVANTWYCGADTGLGRGFTTYRDYIFPDLAAFKWAVLVDRPVEGLRALDHDIRQRFGLDFLRPIARYAWWRFNSGERKEAAQVNAEFLDWLAQRTGPPRPFFAFLNYYDAHYPYELPPGNVHRYGIRPRNPREVELIQNWRAVEKRNVEPREVEFVRDSYDDCVAALDEELGRLVDDLDRRGQLENTWIIVLSDHGESFGEHPGDFGHGTTLYQTELHVPLVMVPPRGTGTRKLVSETVGLRDLPATIVDILGWGSDSPFPGRSLVGLWDSRKGGSGEVSPALAEVVPTDPVEPDLAKAMAARAAWSSLTQNGWVYLRREGSSFDELYNLDADPSELLNLVADPREHARLEEMRALMNQLTGGPLSRDRFPP